MFLGGPQIEELSILRGSQIGPQKDPRWVQKSAPEVSKMDPNWASDDFFVFFCIFIKRYVFQHFWALGTQKMTEKRQNGGPKGGFETYEKSTKIN